MRRFCGFTSFIAAFTRRFAMSRVQRVRCLPFPLLFLTPLIDTLVQLRHFRPIFRRVVALISQMPRLP